MTRQTAPAHLLFLVLGYGTEAGGLPADQKRFVWVLDHYLLLLQGIFEMRYF